jgi:hypothetical protein
VFGVMAGAIIGQGVDILLLVAGVCAALAYMLWKVIIPGAKGITVFNEEIAPNVKYMKDLPKLNVVLSVVEEIAGQFRTNSGSTLKDTTDRLERHAEESKQAAEANRLAAVELARLNRDSITALEVAMGTVRELAKEDRELARRDRDLARDERERTLTLLASAMRTEASGVRVEESGARVEADRAHVAEDLAATQQRADDVPSHEPPGTAADAASQSPEDPDDVR